jgi:tetratricopeptide (TPR) repeat protein
MLLTVLAWLRAALARGSERALMLVAAWILFLCAAASKVIVVTLPPVLLVLDWYPLGRIGRATPAAAAARPSWSPAWLGREAIVAGLEKAPLFAASLVFGLLASVFQHRHEWLYTLEVHPLAGRLAQACYGLVFYFGKTVWPSTLIPIYEIRLPINPLEARFALSAAAVAVAATLLVALRRRAPALGAAALAYLIFLAPVSGLMQNGPQIAADRYTYLPLMGFAILAGGLAAAAWSSPHTPRGARVGLAILAAGVVALLASLSWQQCRIWRTTSTLWAYAAAAAPESSVARNSHGYMLLVQGRYDEALSHLREAVRLQPANLTAHENIWILLRRRGDGPEARIAGYRESLRILPEYTDAEYQLGKALVEQEQYAEAVGHLRTVLARKSGHVNAHLALAIALMKQGDWDGSIRHNELAVLADPNNAQARFNLAEVLRVVGRDEDAIFHLGEVLRIEPNHAQARQRLDRLLNPQSPGAASPGSPGSP